MNVRKQTVMHLPERCLTNFHCSARRLTTLPYNTGGSGDSLDGMVLTPYTLPGQAYSEYNLGVSCALYAVPVSPCCRTSACTVLG